MSQISDRYNHATKMTVNSDGSINVKTNYETNDIIEASTTVIYIGMEDKNGNWWIKKVDTSSNNSFSHATELNNSTITTYSSAITARATLTYGRYSSAF